MIPERIHAAISEVPSIDAALASRFICETLLEDAGDGYQVSELINIDATRLEGASRKIGNVCFNLGGLLQQVPDIVLSAWGVDSLPSDQRAFLVPLVALSIIAKFAQVSKVSLRTTHCGVLLALAAEQTKTLTRNEIIAAAPLMMEAGQPHPEVAEIDLCLAELSELKCIEQVADSYRLRERVRLL